MMDCPQCREPWNERKSSRIWAVENIKTRPAFHSTEREQYKTDILNCEGELEVLCARVDALREKLARARSIISPVALLPDDVLGDILDAVAEADPKSFTFDPNSLNVPSILLVSRQWREVALSTSSLWRMIDLQSPLSYRSQSIIPRLKHR